MKIQIIVLLATFVFGEGYQWCGIVEKMYGYCEADHYIPAHGTMRVRKFQPSHDIVETQNLILRSIAYRSGMLTKTKVDGLIFLDSIEGIHQAPEHACSLMIIEKAFNVTNTFSYSVQTILRSMESIIEKLSTEVNTKIQVMGSYLAKNLKKELLGTWQDVFKLYFEVFVACLKQLREAGNEGVNSCLEEVDWVSMNGKKHFMLFLNKIGKTWKPVSVEIRKMEAHLVMFRHFANFRLIILLTLVNAHTKGEDKRKTGVYLSFLKTELTLYRTYGNFLLRHIENFYNIGTIVDDDVTFSKDSECAVSLNSMLPDEKCNVKTTITPLSTNKNDDKERLNCSEIITTDTPDETNAQKEFMSSLLKHISGKYRKDMTSLVHEYWSKKIKASLLVWKELYEATLIHNRGQDAENYKLKPHQMKNVNLMYAHIKNHQNTRKKAQEQHVFTRDEL